MTSSTQPERPIREQGQALVEFALSLPILLLFIMGLIDFSIILFSYTQASNSLRDALRYAQLIGYSADTVPYLNCTELDSRASHAFFTASHNVQIQYIKANDTSIVYNDCPTVTNDMLDNGDILQIDLTATIDPFFLPLGRLTMDFTGERSIVKMIPVSGVSPDLPEGTPARPANFRATARCETGTVDFAWDPISPQPTKVEIHEGGTRRLVNAVDPVTVSECIGCDSIDPTLGERCYYAVAFNNSLASPPSYPECTYCIADPTAPANFTANVDCASGDVTFAWDWGDTDPPTRAEIRDQDGNVVVDYTEDMFVTECPDCDSIPLPGTQTYTIVAIREAGTETRTSAPSAPATVTCSPDTSSVVGHLRAAFDGTCTDYGRGFAGETVTLIDPATMTTISSAITDTSGYFVFNEVPAGSYELQVPLSVVSGTLGYITRTDGATCYGALNPFPVTVPGGTPVQFTIGYQ